MPARKYENQTKYLLRVEKGDMDAYRAAARAERISLADWMNRELRASLKRQERRSVRAMDSKG